MNRSFLFVLATFGLVSPAWSEDKATPDLDTITKIMMEAAKPGPEHQKLQPLEGNWTYTSKFWMDPSQPPMESTGTIQRKWTLGNRFLEEKVTGTGFDGKTQFEGRGMIGYDNAQKKFTSGWVCSMSTGVSTSLGTSDASGKNFEFEREDYCPIRQKKVKGRDEIRIESNDKNVMVMYEIENGKEKKVMELISIRQK